MFFPLLSLLSLASLLHLVGAISPAEIDAFLTVHNSIRAVHKAPPLEWSAELANLAENWASHCVFARTEGVLRDAPYGELHAAATGIFPIETAIYQFVKDESNVYSTTHFTTLKIFITYTSSRL